MTLRGGSLTRARSTMLVPQEIPVESKALFFCKRFRLSLAMRMKMIDVIEHMFDIRR